MALDHARLRASLRSDPTMVGKRDGLGCTLLHWAAAAMTDGAAAGLLLDAGADVDARDRGQKTPLHIAVSSGRGDAGRVVVRLLIARGATLDARDHTGVTPLYADRAVGRDDLAAVLESAGTGAPDISPADVAADALSEPIPVGAARAADPAQI